MPAESAISRRRLPAEVVVIAHERQGTVPLAAWVGRGGV